MRQLADWRERRYAYSKGTSVVEFLFYVTIAVTLVAVVASLIYWVRERKDRS